MDLVDIDKVLDDLELNEGDPTKIEAKSSHKSANAVPTVSGGSEVAKKSEKSIEDASSGVNIGAVSVDSVTTELSKEPKRFIGVSQVFSSLDDYCKDVESLKCFENDVSLEDVKDNDMEPDETAKDNEDRNKAKFPESPEEDATDDGECQTISSSITTSSPSSFSSGPSPRVSSEEETCSMTSDLTGKIEEFRADQAMGKCENDAKANEKVERKNEEKLTVKFQEIGLSSISSCFYNESTLSSLPGFSQDILQTEDDHLSSSMSLSHEMTATRDDIDELSSGAAAAAVGTQLTARGGIVNPAFESTVSQLERMDDERKLCDDEDELRKENVAVTFGSTMDEISDTELDSMLQEIDSELQNFYVPQWPGTSSSSLAGGDVGVDDEENDKNERVEGISIEKEEISEKQVSILIVQDDDEDADEREKDIATTLSSDLPVSRRMVGENHEENLQNADSFSQASTIEFAELRLQSDFGPAAATLAATADLSDISTSSNSGAKNEPQTQPIRPNSLDLPGTSSASVAANSNLNASAGQTPPASRIDDSTTLSTDDENTDRAVEPDQWLRSNTAAPGVSSPHNNNNNNTHLGKIPPFWIPDSEANACMQCKQKFSLLKRRHHCRACGQVLCSICCSQKSKLEFLGDTDQRVCVQCHLILSELQENASRDSPNTPSPSETLQPILGRPPNPNNPMEYCSMIPPHQQVNSETNQTPISVMVPVGVLKREGAPKSSRKEKTVIFSDGIRPGCDLTALDNAWDDVAGTAGAVGGDGGGVAASSVASIASSSSRQFPLSLTSNGSGNHGSSDGQGRNNFRINRKPSPPKDENDSFISKDANGLPPIYLTTKTEYEYKEVQNNAQLIERLQTETLKFAIQRNFYVFAKIVKLKCCINKTIINFTTFGMHHVGQDELVILLEIDPMANHIPKDIFVHLNEIYSGADQGHPISELGFSMPKQTNFLGRREHGGFLYIRPTFQCLQEIYLPESPFLIGILIHRWEVPWAKIFPLRLMLRLGAQYRYYPSPHISIRGRDSVYAEIAQTIINFLADFRNYSYTLATIKGMYIHMEDRKTSVLIPKNRYDQIVKALNNSSDHILALGGNFSKKADGHLVCIQNMKSDCPDTHTYSTQAINIQGQPRKVTGASFIVLNGALKTTSGLSGKCSIVEDGLMVQILPAKMTQIRNSLKNMKDIEIVCGPVDADETQTEIVSILWTENDVEFNIGVISPIDLRKMDGIPSIRVHSGLNYSNANHIIRWTEVFIIQSDEESAHSKDPIDMSKLAEQIARSTSIALVSFLDLLAARGCVKLGLRATLSQDNVCYEAGSNTKLPPLYMKALDNELIPTLHKQTTMLEIDTSIILELIFHILDK